MAKVITVTLRKGGSGKTTTAVNLASGLAKHGKKVLLVDLDPQANATVSVGLEGIESDPNITDVLQGQKQLAEATHDTGKGFDIVPSYERLSQLEATMATDHKTYGQTIKQILKPALKEYDYIVIDTPPSENMLTIAALVASDYALVPTQAHYLAMHGLQQALDMILRTKQGYELDIEILGILPTMVQTGTNIAELFMEKVNLDYGLMVLPYPIPHTIKITESQLAGEPIIDYDPHHPASIAYMKLAKHVTERGN